MSSSELGARARTFYTRLDADDHAVFDTEFTSDARMLYNDAPPIEGNGAIHEYIDALKGNFASVKHEIRTLLVDDDASTVVAEQHVTYSLKDGTDVEMLGCSIAEFRDGKIAEWRVYVDPSALSGGS